MAALADRSIIGSMDGHCVIFELASSAIYPSLKLEGESQPLSSESSPDSLYPSLLEALTIFQLSCDPTPWHQLCTSIIEARGVVNRYPPKARQMCVETLHNSSKFEAQTVLTFRELEATHGRNAMQCVVETLLF